MRGRFLFWSILAWSCCLAFAQARTNRDAERARAIDQMEKRLQATAAGKRSSASSTKLTGASSPSQAPAGTSALAKSAPNFFERIFGKPGAAAEGTARSVPGRTQKPATKSKPAADPARSEPGRDAGISIAWDSGVGSSGRGGSAPEGAAMPSAASGPDLKGLVGSLLSHMTPMSGGGSDGGVMESGSYRLEDYAYEQRKRSPELPKIGDFPLDGSPRERTSPPGTSSRLIGLLANKESRDVPAVVAAAPEKKREAATALLGSVADNAAQVATNAAAPANQEQGTKDQPAAEGESATYKKAYAKLQTYDVPALPPLRAVSGFQGLMTTKPSEQAVEGGRGGVLSALQLK